MGGTDQARIHFLAGHRADATDLTFLHKAEQTCLGRQRQFANLVQEQCAAVCGFDKAHAITGGAREGAFLITEQLRFDKRVRNSGAVNGDDRTVGSGANAVNLPRCQFFTGSRLADNQNSGVGLGDALDLILQRLHRCTGFADVMRLCAIARCELRLLLTEIM